MECTRTHTPDWDEISFDAPPATETCLVLAPARGVVFAERVRAAGRLLAGRGLAVVRCEMFGPADHLPLFQSALRDTAGTPLPCTWVVPHGAREAAGAITAVGGTPVTLNAVDGHAVAAAYRFDGDTWCSVSGLLPPDGAADPEDQAAALFRTLEQALTGGGFQLTDLVRTWFFLDLILAWYGPFNTVRTTLYRERGFAGGRLPASTGIGAANPAGRTLTAAALAVRSPDPGRPRQIASPRQCAATRYGSSFSRAMAVGRKLFISGTAGIAADGTTDHPGDPAGQVACTMEAVAAIAAQAGTRLSETIRGVVYWTDERTLPLFGDWCRAHAAAGLPVVTARTDICRSDLLFEIELDLLLPKTGA
ncbi:MAG: hypothetical protein ABIF71_03435 [Planctomycetota bacterium]